MQILVADHQDQNIGMLIYLYWSLRAGLVFLEGFLMLFAESDASILALIFQVGIIIPSFAIVARRLHDINKSGWWYLIAFTIIGIIPLIYWLCKAGDDGENKYGPNPLEN